MPAAWPKMGGLDVWRADVAAVFRPSSTSEAGAAPDAPAWHAQPAEAVLGALRTRAEGLGGDEAARRLAEHGPNQLQAEAARPAWRRLLEQFNNVLILLLLAAAVAAGALGEWVDAGVIAAVVIINAVIGFIQEGQAEQALAAIRSLVSPHAHVFRDGRRVTLEVAELVPGDVVWLEAGDRVPADLRLLRASSLAIDEALLTGESVPADKDARPVAPDAALGDRRGMAYSGTLVTAGQGLGIVVATARHTEIGRISSLLAEVQTLTTPLLRQVNAFGQRLTWIVLAASAGLFAFAVNVRGQSTTDALMAVIGMAVSVIPEGLPAVMTITLAIGVQRMAARRAIIRRLPAVETLGATSVICTDKTGTLTRNEMTARQLWSAGVTAEASGAGYDPAGELRVVAGEAGRAGSDSSPLDIVRAGLLCNDAHLRQADGVWRVEGDPMEGALTVLAHKAGLDPAAEGTAWPRLQEIPFDAAHRYMLTLHRAADGRHLACMKGAPEAVMAACSSQLGTGGGEEPLNTVHWEACVAEAAARGERVLGFAQATEGLDGTDRLATDALPPALVFLGLVSFADPPREEAKAAVAACRQAGIAVKMITGDHAATAAAIAEQLGLAERPRAVTGAELDGVGDGELAVLAREAAVFARTSPQHKLRIVQALQAEGAVVAMTGDGVNDAPSLKQADVGVAMGIKGTEAAKEAAQMVLADDNFASIVAAVHEGRTVYDNLRKVIAWALPTNGGQGLVILGAILLGWTLPVTPAQILWVNMISSVTLGLVLAFEPSEPGVMQRPPRRPDAPLISGFMLWRVAFVSVLLMLASAGTLAWALAQGADLATARTLVVNTLMVLQTFYLFNVRYLDSPSITWRGVLGTRPVLLALGALILAQAAFTWWPPMQALFGTSGLSPQQCLVALGSGVALLLVLEAEKWILRAWQAGRRR